MLRERRAQVGHCVGARVSVQDAACWTSGALGAQVPAPRGCTRRESCHVVPLAPFGAPYVRCAGRPDMSMCVWRGQCVSVGTNTQLVALTPASLCDENALAAQHG